MSGSEEEIKKPTVTFDERPLWCFYCRMDPQTAVKIHDSIFLHQANPTALIRRYNKEIRAASAKEVSQETKTPGTPLFISWVRDKKKVIRKHYAEAHQPSWLYDFDILVEERQKNTLFTEITKNINALGLQLVNGKISDDDYIEKVKLISFSNMIANPQKVSVRQGLEAIKLGIEKQKLGVQQSESLRNWMKLLSGLPDKQVKPVNMGPVTEIKPFPVTQEAEVEKDRGEILDAEEDQGIEPRRENL